jgi:glycosyltransferase involved in cell wall biosynthesis
MTRSAVPRVLVVTSDDITAASGTGITLRNLFGEWPEEAIAQVHLSEKVQSPGTERLRYPPEAFPIDRLARQLLAHYRPALADGAPKIAAVPLPADATQAARRHASLRAILDLSPMLPSRAVDRFIKRFSPDVVYSLLGSVRVTRLAVAVSRRYDVPLVPHFMDDWPATLYSAGELHGVARKRLGKHLERALARSPLALCISDAMCEEFQVRYGLPCHTFVNPVEISAPAPRLTGGSALELLYVGGLHLGRWDSLLLVGRALARVGTRAHLTVYAPPSDIDGAVIPRELAGVVRVGGTLEPTEVQARLRDADAFVHVESFDESASRYTRLSLSTKVPQYLAAGRPILAVGPEPLASMHVVRASGGGLVVTDPTIEAAEHAIRLLASDPGLRKAMGARGRAYATENFSAAVVRQRLARALMVAAGRG